ncbi:MAG TPA: hypothetical protein VFZ62_02345 [Candidatus Saccharimonadales bacterium]
MRFRRALTLCFFALLVASGSSVFLVGDASAANAHNFNAGRIIDDGVFTNKNAMNVQEIQNFLNSKVTCDTWGQKRSELGGGTRAQWMNARGIYAPFRCITDYKENTVNGQNNYGKNETPAGAISAAQIIYNYSQQFNINPQVLIVTLQKENGMITDEWPTPKQFSEAMGFGCPDNVAPGAPACDPQYGSFAAQIYQAARHFRGYINNQAGWWVPFNTGWNSIAWSPTASCGRGDVYIENRATVALYSYTPYQPNWAAKNAQYGLGDGCSAYGNRNFYLYFTDWFGSTAASVSITSPLRVSSTTTSGHFTKVPTTVSFDISNNANYPMGIGSMAVTVRDSQGRNLDYALQPIYIPAHSTVTYRASQVLPIEETYTFGIVNFLNGTWRDDYPASSNLGNARTVTAPVVEMPTLTSSLSVQNELRVGKATPVTFTVKNNSAGSLNVGRIAAGIRGPNNENYDLAPDNIVLGAGQSYVYTKSFTPAREGQHKISIVSTLTNGATWEDNYPLPANGITNTVSSVVRPAVTQISSVAASSTGLRTGQSTNLSFTLKNYSGSAIDLGKIGLYGRDPNGANVDPGVVPVTLSAGEERVVSLPFTPSVVGAYKFGILQTKNNGATWSEGPDIEVGGVQKNLTLPVASGVTLLQGPLFSSNSLYVGAQDAVTIKLKNYGTQSIDLGKVGLMGRDPNGANVDPGVVPVTLSAGEERTLSFPFSPNLVGRYTFGVLSTKDNGATWREGPDVDGASVSKKLSIDSRTSTTVTQSVASSSSILHAGASTNLLYKVKNHSSVSVSLGKIGLYGRDPNGANVDPGVVPVTLSAGEERVVSLPFTPTITGVYKFGILQTRDNGMTWSEGPEIDSSSVQKTFKPDVKPATTVISGVSASPSSILVNGQTTVSFTVKNHSANSINLGKVGLMGRDPNGANVDPGVVPVTLSAGEEKVISFNLTLNKQGKYKFTLLGTFDNGQTWNLGPVLETSDQRNTVEVTVS